MICQNCLKPLGWLVSALGDELRFCPFCGAQITEPPKPLTKREQTEQMLAARRKDLNRLEERAANYGMDVPIALLNEIDAAKGDIERLIAEIRALGN